jgi:nucleoside-diphosphate-sugar epimerase
MRHESVLVTGATGFIGRALTKELQSRGCAARCAVRATAAAGQLHGPVVEVGEVNATTDWAQALSGVDVVIHLVARAHVLNETADDPDAAFNAVNLDGTRRLAQCAAARGVRRLVYVSSIGVNGEFAPPEAPFTEASVAAPRSLYAASKYAAERALRKVASDTGLEIVILRPPLVYGPGNPGNFIRLLKLVERGLPLPLASVRNQRSMIYVANLVDALIAAAFQAEAAGRLYLVSDTERVGTPQLIREIATQMGRPARMWSLPVGILRRVAKFAGKSDEIEKLIGSLVIDSTRIRQELGWSPPFTLYDGLAQTVRWFRENKAS